MLWGAISFHGRSELIRVQFNLTWHRYRDEILAPVVVPFFNANRNVTLFKQDNTRCHTARVSISYLDEQMLGYCHGWHSFQIFSQSKICEMCLIVTLDVMILKTHTDLLEEVLRQEWEVIPLHEIQNLIRSMHRRCITVVNANGGHTRYWTICDFLKWPLCNQWQ